MCPCNLLPRHNCFHAVTRAIRYWENTRQASVLNVAKAIRLYKWQTHDRCTRPRKENSQCSLAFGFAAHVVWLWKRQKAIITCISATEFYENKPTSFKLKHWQWINSNACHYGLRYHTEYRCSCNVEKICGPEQEEGQVYRNTGQMFFLMNCAKEKPAFLHDQSIFFK